MRSGTSTEREPLSVEEAARWDARWRRVSLEQVIQDGVARYGAGLGVMSAFGPGSLVVIHIAYEMGVRLPVVFIDTLHHFPETLDLVERVRERYAIDLRVARPTETREEFEALHGPRLWERDIDLYQRLSKVEPCERITAGFSALITGRRRTQAETRSRLPLVEPGERPRINPLASWSREEVWRFILDHHIPYNALHDRGYGSIGDQPLTTPVGADEHERAGRWRGIDRIECGIHGA